MPSESAAANTLVDFRNVPGPVALEECDSLLPVLRRVFRYWPHAVQDKTNVHEPVIRVWPGKQGRYWLDAAWLEKPTRYTNDVNLACGLGVNVNQAFLNGPGDYLCLHSAAAAIGGRLVVFPNAYRAGKSMLSVCLAAAGARVYSDDILPVDRQTGRGMAIGITPRLRLPLPETLSQETVDFIAARRGPENSQYLYVDLRPDEQAPFGETAPFGGVVLLDRQEEGPASLEPVGVGEALKHLVLRNFARKVPVETSLDRLHQILASAYCARLTYSAGDDAARLLVERLADWDALDRPARLADTPDAGTGRARPAGGRGRLRRRDGVRERMTGGELFLVDSSEQAIYHLNAIGTGLWRLLDGACDIDEAVDILHEAFPETGRDQVEKDVGRLVASLLARGLLVEAGSPDPE